MSDNLPISEQYRLVAFEARMAPEPNTGCWLWTGMYQVGKEYGLFCFKRKTVKAHRAAWEIYRSPIPPGLHVLHKCDVPACVNPDHLFLGTHMDNMRDRDAKGRTKAALGERQHLAKFNAAQVLQIRKRLSAGASCADLGREIGVSKSTIERIKNRKTWAHV